MKTITRSEELARVCEDFAKSPFLTVDTEFIRERTFWSQLCLVQLARPGNDPKDPEDVVLIDPLAEGIALDPLFALMADPNVVKVFHAARQDVEIFYHLGKVIPSPLFDTQVAAMVLNYGEQVGYETLVRRVAKVELDKTSRFTDWSRRPLSDKQCAYAAADVTHLRVVYEALSARLEESGRAGWLDEELAILADPSTYKTEPEDAWRRVKARSQSPKFLAVVQALAKWREITAQDRDIPRNRVLKDDALLEIATARPQTVDALGGLRLVPRDLRRPGVAEQIVEAVKEGESCPPDQRPSVKPPPRRMEGSAAIADLLRVFLKARAEELGIAAKLLASSSDLEALAGENDPDLPLLRGWRHEVFGADALRVKAGEVALAAKPGGVRLVEVE
ncbi:MAG: ribonuclease D [Pseudomonadota bacterium]